MGKKGKKTRQSTGRTKSTKQSRSNRASNARRHAPNDGGAWALAGYAYQFLGSAVLSVSKDYDSIADAGDLTLHVETYGQDAAAVQSDSIELIQFKFSETAKDIAPQEFADILRAFEASTGRIGQTVPTVTWKLITNRQLSPHTVSLRDNPQKKRGPTSAADAALIQKHGQRCAHDLRRSADLHALIEDRARSFGVSTQKMTSAKQNVKGYLLDLIDKPEGSRVIDNEELEGKLAGHPNPRSMRPDEFVTFAREDLARIVSELDGKPIEDIVPRRVVQELLTTPALGIAVVTGHGGCGKTRSVLRGLYDSLDRRRWLAGALVPGPNPKAESLELLVNRWRSTGQLDPENPDKCWQRIRVAAAGFAKPVIVLALDGIDEVGSAESAKRNVAELIAHFRTVARQVEPEGLLIVTCRARETIDRYVRYEGTGAPEPSGVHEFPLGDFDEREFVAVWQKWFTGEALPEIALQSATSPVMGGTQGNSLELRMRLEALRHPALLGCARGLSESERQGLFQGDDAVWIKLLEVYRRWFAHKVRRRKGYDEQQVQAVLKAVARACQGLQAAPDTYDLEVHWVTPAKSDLQLGNEMILDVFRDAISCGLIKSPGLAPYTMSSYMPVPWTWRFRFLQTHLAKLI